jgi:hypothetical protein
MLIIRGSRRPFLRRMIAWTSMVSSATVPCPVRWWRKGYTVIITSACKTQNPSSWDFDCGLNRKCSWSSLIVSHYQLDCRTGLRALVFGKTRKPQTEQDEGTRMILMPVLETPSITAGAAKWVDMALDFRCRLKCKEEVTVSLVMKCDYGCHMENTSRPSPSVHP